jgi:adenine-specific DNA-methyltransferase
LKLAKALLKDDGAIFISINDNEMENLIKICNEIFGESNFIAVFPWQSRLSVQNDTDISNNHEYVIAYAKKRRQENRRLKETNVGTWFKEESFVCLPLPLNGYI